MKTIVRRIRERANTLFIVLTTVTLLTVIFGSYLSLLSRQNQSVMRSMSWNSALAVAEAGIEEAFSHINQTPLNYATDNWSSTGTNYAKQRTLNGDNFSVTIVGNPGQLLTITSTGSVSWLGSSYVTRTVQVQAQSSAVISQVGLIAKNINLGGNFLVDSYDSTTNLYSTGGQYDPAKASDKAYVATPGLTYSIGGSAHIYGYVETAPGGTVTAKGAATVGSLSWVNKGIQPGHALADFTNAIPDVQVPYTSGTAPAAGSVSGTSYNYVLSGGKYMSDTLDSGGSGTTLAVTGPSVLYVTGNIQINSITFSPGATLDLYVATPTLSITPTIVGGGPPQFTVWALPSCTSMTLNAGMTFTGVLYGPEMDLKMTGNATVCGALVAHSFNGNGGFSLHYDEATANMRTNVTVKIQNWAEL